jgi:hypothetical protein
MERRRSADTDQRELIRFLRAGLRRAVRTRPFMCVAASAASCIDRQIVLSKSIGIGLAMTMLKCDARKALRQAQGGPRYVRDRTSRHDRGAGEVPGRRLPLRAGRWPGHSNEPGRFSAWQSRRAALCSASFSAFSASSSRFSTRNASGNWTAQRSALRSIAAYVAIRGTENSVAPSATTWSSSGRRPDPAT